MVDQHELTKEMLRIIQNAESVDQGEQDLSLLISLDVNIEARNRNGETPLMLAVQYGRANIVEFLIAQGANVNVEDRKQRTPLHIAAQSRNPRIAKLLLNSGANPNAVDRDGLTPLQMTTSSRIAALITTHKDKTICFKQDEDALAAFQTRIIETSARAGKKGIMTK